MTSSHSSQVIVARFRMLLMMIRIMIVRLTLMGALRDTLRH